MHFRWEDFKKKYQLSFLAKSLLIAKYWVALGNRHFQLCCATALDVWYMGTWPSDGMVWTSAGSDAQSLTQCCPSVGKLVQFWYWYSHRTPSSSSSAAATTPSTRTSCHSPPRPPPPRPAPSRARSAWPSPRRAAVNGSSMDAPPSPVRTKCWRSLPPSDTKCEHFLKISLLTPSFKEVYLYWEHRLLSARYDNR